MRKQTIAISISSIPTLFNGKNYILRRLNLEIQLTIKMSEKTERRFGVILAPYLVSFLLHSILDNGARMTPKNYIRFKNENILVSMQPETSRPRFHKLGTRRKTFEALTVVPGFFSVNR